MLKQQLQQKLQQKLSPQQIQLIRLLELPAIELEERSEAEAGTITQLGGKEKSLLMILNELKARRGEKRSLLLILRPTFLWEII